MNQKMSKLNEQDQMLLMKYYDGECTDLERVMVERLLRNSSEAEIELQGFAFAGEAVDNFMTAQVEAMEPSAGFSIEDFAREVKPRETRGLGQIFGIDWADILFGLGWASSGALVTASVLLVVGMSSSPSLDGPVPYASDAPQQASFVNRVESNGQTNLSVTSKASDNHVSVPQQPVVHNVPSARENNTGVESASRHDIQPYVGPYRPAQVGESASTVKEVQVLKTAVEDLNGNLP